MGEGKGFISDSGYAMLVEACRNLHKSEKTVIGMNKSIFAWSWLTLQWNLLSRTSNVMDIHLEHIDWFGDGMKITFAKSKGI